MKLILISGYGYSERVSIVEAKETEKSFMVDGLRFKKSMPNNMGSIAENAKSHLYEINNKYALSKLKKKQHYELCRKIEIKLNKGVSEQQAIDIAKILNIEHCQD